MYVSMGASTAAQPCPTYWHVCAKKPARSEPLDDETALEKNIESGAY